MRIGSRALAYFTTETDSGRDLFRVENIKAIRDLAKTLLESSGSAQGAFSSAWKQLWDYADHEFWDHKARTEIDIYAFVSFTPE